MRAAFVDLPIRIGEMLPTRRKGARHGGRTWTRPRRIALVLTVLVVAGGVAATVVIMQKGRDPARETWRLHDETVEDFRAGRFDAVVVKCRKILDHNAGDMVARFNLGAALMRLGQTDEGLREVRRAADGHPSFDDAHMVLADVAMAAGDEDTALAELRLVTAEPPTPGVAEAQMATILRRRGRDAEAMPHLAAAAADPLADAVVRVRSGVTLGRLHGQRATVAAVASREKRLEMDAYSQARQVVDAAIASSSAAGRADVAELYAARAELHLAQNPRDQTAAGAALADADLAVAAAADPAARASMQMLRAQLYSILGDTTKADQELAETLRADAKPSAGSFRNAASIYLARGDAAHALEVLTHGAEFHPSDLELGLDRAYLLFRTGDLDGAEAESVRLAAVDPRGTAAPLLRGDLRRARDDLAGARAAYAEALARSPGDTDAQLRLAGTAFDESGMKAEGAAERLAESERIANEVLAKSPSDPGALLALAKVRLAASPGRDPKKKEDRHPVNEEARKLLLASVEGNPLSIEARTFLAYAHYLTRNEQDAAVELQQVLAVMPDERPRLRLLLARCLLEAGSNVEAASAARRAAESLPDDPAAWSVRAEAARAAGDRDGALTALARLETLEPQRLEHLFAQAALLAEGGRFAAAEERFAVADERALALGDENARASAQASVATARSEFYRLRGDIEKAKGAFGAVLDKNPTSAAPYVRYARFLLKVGQSEDAERQVERGLAVEPASVEARRMLCEIWFARGEASKVLVAQVDEVARIAPKDPVVDYLRGKLAVLAGDLRVGKELLARYADAVPDDPDAEYALGVTLGRAGEYDDAVKHLEAAGRLIPGSPEVRVALAKVRQAWALEMMRRGRVVEAQAALRRAVSDDPGAREARAMLVDSLRLTGDVDLSEREVRALLYADPADRAAMRMLGALQVQAGRLDEAAATLRRLTDIASEDWAAWQFLSAVLADKGDLDGAEVAAKSALRASPDEPGALAALLHVLVRRGDFDGAEREIAAAIGKHADVADYQQYLAMLREQQGRHEDAAAAAGRALDIRPSMPAALELAIFALSAGLGDPARAEAFARERVAKAKDDLVMRYQLAALLSDMGRRDDALALLATITGAEPPLLPAFSLRAVLLLETGDLAAARALLKSGIDAFADAPDLHYLLAQSWLSDPASVKDGDLVEPARGFAVAELRAVVRVVRTHAPALNNLAWLLSRDEATRAEALEYAERIVQIYESYPPYLDTWGTVLLRLGRTDQAVTAFRRALGACEGQRSALAKRRAGKVPPLESARIDALERRLDRVKAEVKAHYDEALEASKGR